MNSQTKHIKVLQTSPWVQYHPEDLPVRIVMWKPDDETARQTMYTERQHVTHTEVKQEDGTLSFAWGHYDMSLQAATEDFNRRVALLTENRPNNIYKEMN